METRLNNNIVEKIKRRVYSKGCRNILLALLEKEMRWSDLGKIEDGKTVSECIDLLISIGFVEPVIDFNSSVKGVKKYKLTKKGLIFVEHLKEADKILKQALSQNKRADNDAKNC